MRALILVGSAALAIAACDDGGGKQDRPRPVTGVWEIGPIIDGKSVSKGTPPYASKGLDGYSFEIPYPDGAAGHVHQVTKAADGLADATSITLRYRIEAAPGTVIEPVTAPGSPSMLSLFFQRRGDDWSAKGPYEAYRWYSPVFDAPLTPGDHEITVSLNANWTAVLTSSRDSNMAAFAAALNDAERVGFVLGGGTGRAHGVYATGPARFVILDFQITQGGA